MGSSTQGSVLPGVGAPTSGDRRPSPELHPAGPPSIPELPAEKTAVGREHSPYPCGPSAPRIFRRILWSSLKGGATPGLLAGRGAAQRHHQSHADPETAQEDAPSAERTRATKRCVYLQGESGFYHGVREAGRWEAEKRRVHAFSHSPEGRKGCQCGRAGSEGEEATAWAGGRGPRCKSTVFRPATADRPRPFLCPALYTLRGSSTVGFSRFSKSKNNSMGEFYGPKTHSPATQVYGAVMASRSTATET